MERPVIIPAGAPRNQDEPRYAVMYNHPSGVVIQGQDGPLADAYFKVFLALSNDGADRINCIQRTA